MFLTPRGQAQMTRTRAPFIFQTAKIMICLQKSQGTLFRPMRLTAIAKISSAKICNLNVTTEIDRFAAET